MHIVLINNVIIETIYPFQNFEDDIRRNLFEQRLQRINTKVLFSECQSDLNKKAKYAPVKGVHPGDTKRWILSLQQEHMSYM